MGKIYDALEKFEAEKSVKKVKSAERSHIAPSQPSDLQISTNPPPVRQKHAFDENINKNLVTLNDPLGFESEQFKILRTMLLFPQSGERARTIMVTSALPEEGKSFVAANLAVSLAQNINEYVLLIDGDIRHPTQHSIFGFHNVPGLSEHLSKGAQIPDLLLKTRVNKLSLLPGGRHRRTPPNCCHPNQCPH